MLYQLVAFEFYSSSLWWLSCSNICGLAYTAYSIIQLMSTTCRNGWRAEWQTQQQREVKFSVN